MFIILVSYRAREPQCFRRNEIKKMIENVNTFFSTNNIEYKIVICEQNNDIKFNRGILLNIAFLESEKLFRYNKKYIHMNTDYTFNLDRKFPIEFLNLQKGFLDLYRFPYPILGSACVFDPESYKEINGFPNDLYGWGGDDWAIYNRIMYKKINIETPDNLFNSGFILEECNTTDHIPGYKDTNDNNMKLARRNDIYTNGLNSCRYNIDNNGEFHDGNIVFHYLASF